MTPPMGLFSPSEKQPRPPIPKVDQNLVAIGGDLSVPSLLQAYRQGRFPWTVSPITWWSPDPRAVLEFGSLRIPRSLTRFIRKYDVTADLCFREVMEGCAEKSARRPTTWITPEFISAYSAMHDAGHAHSLECWHDGRLAGGLYGLALGGCFVGESMFSRETDASKVVLATLARHLMERSFVLFDVQMPTRVTIQMGASLVPRAEYLKRLREALLVNPGFGPPGRLAKPI